MATPHHPPTRRPPSPLARRPVQLTVLALTSLAVAAQLAWRRVTPVFPQSAPGDKPTPVRFEVDLNRAGVEELSLLPGVGPVLARRIVRLRTKIGGFRRLEALDRVSGIGPKRLEQIAPLLSPLDEPSVADLDAASGPRPLRDSSPSG